MSQKNQRNQQQARWILAQGLVSQEHLRAILKELSGQSRGDLSSHLLARGLINPQQAMQARRASGQVFSTVMRRRSGYFVRESLREHSGSSSGEFVRDLPAANAQMRQSTGLGMAVPQIPGPPGAPKPKILTASKLPGQKFRDYELLREISRGAMGVIFQARHPNYQKLLALKFIQQETPNETEVERFRREMNALIRLRHPNIIEIYDVGSQNNRLFYAMEFIEGEDLFKSVEAQFRKTGEGPSWQRIVKIFTSVAKAIQYCHENQLIHRDIKPQNIVVEKQTERPVLVDFGLMKQEQAEASEALTMIGEIIGTPAFMSPEQFSPGGSYGEISSAIDVWGFGTSLFYCLAGESPFHRPTAVEIFQAITTEPIPRLKDRVPDCPDWLDDLVSECLQKQAHKRPSIDEVLARLEKPETKRPTQNSQLTLILFMALVLVMTTIIVLLLVQSDSKLN